MGQIFKRLTIIFGAFLCGTTSKGQNLSPKVLNDIQNSSEFSNITTLLVEKGFKMQSTRRNDETMETVGRWYFQPFTNSGEEVSSYLIKTVDSSQKAKTVFLLYNPFHYKDFIKNLVDAKYKFKGTKFLDGHIYYIFKNKRYTFSATEKTTLAKQKYFEILLKTN